MVFSLDDEVFVVTIDTLIDDAVWRNSSSSGGAFAGQKLASGV
jgi:hypothetical protein